MEYFKKLLIQLRDELRQAERMSKYYSDYLYECEKSIIEKKEAIAELENLIKKDK